MSAIHIALLCACAIPVAAYAQAADPLKVTPTEEAACKADAERLCAATYPDEGRLLSCMQANRTALTPTCLQVFDAGMKRRGL